MLRDIGHFAAARGNGEKIEQLSGGVSRDRLKKLHEIFNWRSLEAELRVPLNYASSCDSPLFLHRQGALNY